MKCFLTGATGFLGSHVARQLLSQGAQLRLLVRPTSRIDNIADLPAERVVGDLRDLESLKRGMSGCEFVFRSQGAQLRLLVRPTSRIDNIADLPAERVVGDLRDLESLKRGMSGCEFVF